MLLLRKLSIVLYVGVSQEISKLIKVIRCRYCHQMNAPLLDQRDWEVHTRVDKDGLVWITTGSHASDKDTHFCPVCGQRMEIKK